MSSRRSASPPPPSSAAAAAASSSPVSAADSSSAAVAPAASSSSSSSYSAAVSRGTRSGSLSANGAPLSLAESVGYRGYLHADPAPDPPRTDPVPIPAAAAAAAAAAGSGAAAATSPSSGGDIGSPSDALVPYSSSSEGSGAGSCPPQRQFARKALQAVSNRATSLLTANTASSKVMAFGVHTTVRVANAFIPQTARNLALHYGDPLLSKIDQRLDEAFQVVETSRLGAHYYSSPVMSAAEASPASSPSDSAGSGSVGGGGAGVGGVDRGSGGTDPSALMLDSSSDSECKDGGMHLTLHQEDQAMYAMYWQQLKAKFVNSVWYSKVDSILLQNRVVEAFSARMMRPAESFYNTVTEEFLSHDNMDDFMGGLKDKIGPAWDDRLAPLAKGFYSTAKAVSAVVGAGRFVGGALQLGRASVHNAIEQLMQRWEEVLGTGDQYVDRWLPEREAQGALMPGSEAGTALVPVDERTEAASAADLDLDSVIEHKEGPAQAALATRRFSYAAAAAASAASPASSAGRSLKKRPASALDESAYQTDGDESSVGGDASASLGGSDSCTSLSTLAEVSSAASAHPSVADLAHKTSKRLRQRIPTLQALTPALVSGWSDSVRARLAADRWFVGVDDILMQNSFVQALAAFMQPADHFYNTALQLFQTRVLKNPRALEEAEEQLALPSPSAPMQLDSPATTSDASAYFSPSPDALLVGAGAGAAGSAPASGSVASSSSASSSPDASSSPVVADFVVSLQRTLGASWDERLQVHARSFFHTAMSAVKQMHKAQTTPAAAS